MTWKNALATIVLSAATAVASVLLYAKFGPAAHNAPAMLVQVPVSYTGYPGATGYRAGAGNHDPVDFEEAAASTIPTVVHVKTTINPRQASNYGRPHNPFEELFGLGDQDPFGDFFRQRMTPSEEGSGSGVLISDDGYIVTNYHLVEGADAVKVTTTDKKTYTAKIVGTDPNTDLAVLKIGGHDFPYLEYGNSDDVRVGQWVLAVGYPWSLEATATAGIISAKSRALGMNPRRRGTSIESYLQTDAAINLGNSGGALVDIDGNLIGINSAIATPTGSFAGYAFAIPVNIVRKVAGDLIQYGSVQRGYLGISYPITDEQRKAEGVADDLNGLYISGVNQGGAADSAGLQKGDVITRIDESPISGVNDFQGKIALCHPGQDVTVTFQRGSEAHTTNVTLHKSPGNESAELTLLNRLGAQFHDLETDKAQHLGVKGGVVVSGITQVGIISQQTMMKDKFVILRVDGSDVTTVDQLKAALQGKASVNIEGIYPGYEGIYQYGLNDLNGRGAETEQGEEQ